MAKQDKLKTPQPSFDDGMSDDMADFDFGMESTKSRTPAGAILTGVKDAAKSHFTSESTIRKYVSKALPNEYGEAFDTYTDSRDKVKSAIDDVKSTLREPVNKFSKAIASKIPQSMKRTHKFLDYLKESTDEYEYKRASKQKEEDNAITASITQLFSAQEKIRKDENDLEKARGDIEKTAELIRFKSSLNALNSIARSSDVMAKQAQGLTIAYQKKSLELQYRTVFALRDMVTEQKLLTAQSKTQLDAIRHNTGLPEAQKLQLNERFKDSIKNKFVDKTYGALANGGKNIIDASLKQFSTSLKEIAEAVAMGLNMGTMGAGMDMDLDLEDEDPVLKRKRKIAQNITGVGLSLFDDKIGGTFKKVLDKSPKAKRAVKRGASHIKNVLGNGESMAREFANGWEPDDKWYMQTMRDVVSMMIPTHDTDTAIKNGDNVETLKGPAVFDGATRRSITDVMPGYLARILQELQITRTGDSNVGMTYFDPTKGKFVSKSDLIAKYNKELEGNGTTKDALDALVAELKGADGNALSAGTGATLQASLLKARTSGSAMTPDAMMRKSYWENTRSRDDADTLAQAFRTYFDSPDGKFSNSDKALEARDGFVDKMQKAQQSINDPRAKIQDAYTMGHGDIMEEMKRSKIKDGAAHIDADRIIDNALGMATSDINAKEDISEVKPESILAKLKKFAISKWKYKPSKSDDQSEKIGPMAQDVNKEFGEKTAPGGKKIDLVSMNGIALGGIQGLQERIDKELGDMKGQSHLEKLVHINTQMYGVLSYMAEHGGMGGGRGKASSGSSKASYEPDEDVDGSLSAAAKATWRRGSAKAKGWWDSSMNENVAKGLDKVKAGAKYTKEHALKAAEAAKRNAGKVGHMAKEMASKSRIFGAKVFEDFKDGLPTMGDVYFGDEDTPRITKARMQAGLYRDAAGKIIRSIADLADAGSEIFDVETGDVIATKTDLLSAYVKSNFKTFSKVFSERVKKAVRAAKAGVLGAFDIGKRLSGVMRDKLNVGGQFAMNLAKEFIMPPRDVYVKGESSPRLLAHSMRLGAYVNSLDGSVIDRPAMIKGVVKDLQGNVLISEVDLVKGLVDSEGQPFKVLVQRMAEFTKKRVAQAAKLAGDTAKAIKDTVQKAVKGVGTFFSHGMSGFRNNGEGESSSSGSGLGSSKSVSLLEQIRDILDARLAGGNGGIGGIGGFVGPQKAAESTNEPTRKAPSSEPRKGYDGGTNILSMAGNALSAGAGMVGKLFGKGKKGAAAEPDAANDEALKKSIKQVQDKQNKEITELKKERKSSWSKVKDAAKNAKDRTQAFVGAKGAAGVKGDTDGNGLRDNSWQELQEKRKNTNLPTGDLNDVQKAGDLGTKNTFDLMFDFLKDKASGIKKLFGGAEDALDNLPDRDGKGGKRGKAGKAGRKAGRKAATRLAQAAAADKAADLAKKAASKKAATLAGKKAGQTVAKTALKFGAGRLITLAGGTIAAILGSPVIGTALVVGGAVWGLKELYDLAGGGKELLPPPTTNKGTLLENLRMAEYGIGGKDSNPYQILKWLEEYLYKSVIVNAGMASLDETKIDADQIVQRFNLDTSNDIQMARFSRWLENRFKPTFLKHAAAAKTAKLETLSGVNSLKAESQLAFFKAVANTTEGHDELSNPFGTSSNLEMDAARVAEIKTVILKALQEQTAKDAPKQANANATKAEELRKQEFKSFIGSVEAQFNGGAAAGKAALAASMQLARDNKQLNAMREDKAAALLKGMEGNKTLYKPAPAATLPDSEVEPKATGAGGSQQGAKAPGVSGLKAASGELFSGAGADPFIKYGPGAKLDTANPEMVKLFRGMCEEYGIITGKCIHVNSGARNRADQARLFAQDPSKAAEPGSSLHEFGLAIDIDSADADALEKLGLMRKYGFTRPVGGETWHIEPAGIQNALTKYKHDQGAAMQAVSFSPGKGGGGVGMTKTGFAKGRRSLDNAMQTMQASDQTVNHEDKTDTASAPPPKRKPMLALVSGGKNTGYASNIAQLSGDAEAERPYSGGAKTQSTPTTVMADKTQNTQEQAQTALNNVDAKGGYDGMQTQGSGVDAMKQLVTQAAEKVGIDPNLAGTTVAVESSFKPGAKNTASSATGLYQFTKGTWNEMRDKHAVSYNIPSNAAPHDPKANALLGALYIKQNMQTASRGGLPANALTAYLMHLLGPSGGKRFLSLGDGDIAATSMRVAAASNKDIFFGPDGQGRTKAQIMSLLQAKLTKAAAAYGFTAPVGDIKTAANDSQVKPGAGASPNASGAPTAPRTASSPDTSVSTDVSAPSALAANAPSSGPTNRYAQEEAARQAMADPRPKTPAAPTMVSPEIARVAQRDNRDPRVGVPSTETASLVETINQGNTLQKKQLDVQTKILQILTELQASKGNSSTPAQETTDMQDKKVQPDRSPRRVSEPAIDLRRMA